MTPVIEKMDNRDEPGSIVPVVLLQYSFDFGSILQNPTPYNGLEENSATR